MAPEPVAIPVRVPAGAGDEPSTARQSTPERRRSAFSKPAIAMAWLAVAGVGVLAVLAVVPRGTREPPASAVQPRISRVTNLGTIRLASLSPDGRRLAYVRAEGVRQSLWLRSQDGTSDVQLLPTVEGMFRFLTFGPDEHAYYTLFVPDRADVALYRVSTRGGAPEMIAEVSGGVAFSPDGSRFAQVSSVSVAGRESRLIVTDVATMEARVLAVRTPPESFVNVKPAWAADGSRLAAFLASDRRPGLLDLVAVDLADEDERTLASLNLTMAAGLSWQPDGAFVVSARERRALPLRLWHVAMPSAAMTPLTHDVSDYALAGTTGGGRGLLAVRSETANSLWSAEMTALDSPRQVAMDSGSLDGVEGIAWVPDGGLLYPAVESGNVDIWAVGPAPGARRRITVDPADDSQPSVSADGRTVAFVSNRSGSPAIWTMSIVGDSVRRLSGGADGRPSISPDARWVVLQRGGVDNMPLTLWRVPLDGGEPARVGPLQSIRPAVSPDGRFIAHYWMTAEDWILAITPVDGTSPARTLPIRPSHSERVVRWSPDGAGLAFIDSFGGASNIWLQPLNGAPLRRLTNVTEGRIATFDWSRDGTKLAWRRVSEIGDVVAIELDDEGRTP